MTPLHTTQIAEIDEARMVFINKLAEHVGKLREELRMSEVILHSVVKSLSAQTQAMADLDQHLSSERLESAHHRPMMSNEGAEELLTRLQVTLQTTTKP